ncbi:hypothetical protein RB595_005249 [Gaeumannomyces hyphopodioides]
MVVRLSSPAGYSPKHASELEKLTSSCGATGYNYVTPTAYTRVAAAATATPTGASASSATPEAPRACKRKYEMKEGDGCHDIALSQNASSYSVIQNPTIDINCVLMPKPGTKLCLDTPCHTHKLQTGQDCEEIAKTYGISTERLIALNPILDSTCSNIDRFSGYVVCVGPTSLLPAEDSASSSESSLFMAASEQAPQPEASQKPRAPNTPDHCKDFYNGVEATDPDIAARAVRAPGLVTPGTIELQNRCSIVAAKYMIHFEELIRLNPSLAKEKKEKRSGPCRLDGKHSYCVNGEGTRHFLRSFEKPWRRERE